MSGLLQFPVTLKIGGFNPEPASAELMNALSSLSITETDSGPSGFQISFRAERSPTLTQDYALLSNPILQPFNRVRVLAAAGGQPAVLIDGFITHQQLDPGPEGALLTITGEDASVMMDLIEISFMYPSIPDYLIVNAVLLKYAAIGIVPLVDPSVGTIIPDPLQVIPQQNATDRDYVTHLACKHASVFYIEPGPTEGMLWAYWGPPTRSGTPQKALSVNQGPFTNVKSLRFSLDARAPYFVNGMVQDTFFTDMDLPVTTLTSTVDPLAASPVLDFTSPTSRHDLFQHQGLDIISATIKAQAMTDKSTFKPVTAEGELDAFLYGDILRARSLVDVRGAGHTYDGTYYVQSVTHQISPGEYSQQFTLNRGGTGSTVQRVSA